MKTTYQTQDTLRFFDHSENSCDSNTSTSASIRTSNSGRSRFLASLNSSKSTNLPYACSAWQYDNFEQQRRRPSERITPIRHRLSARHHSRLRVPRIPFLTHSHMRNYPNKSTDSKATNNNNNNNLQHIPLQKQSKLSLKVFRSCITSKYST